MKQQSLRNRLLKHVLLRLALTWLVGSVVGVLVASHFTQQAYDRSLLDDAYLLASRVAQGRDPSSPSLVLNLSTQDLGTVLFDQSEAIFFAIYDEHGQLIAGHPGLNTQSLVVGAPPRFQDVALQNKSLRSVVLYKAQPLPFFVVIAQTNSSRSNMLENLLLYTLVPQMLLLLGLGLGLRYTIQKDIDPLLHLEHAILQRDVRDLSPIEVMGESSDIRRLTRAFNDLLLRIQQGVQAHREFSGNVAHELRTPMAGIRALAEYGLQQTDPAQWREQLTAIVKSEARVTHLVDQMLALALADEAEQGMPLIPLRIDQALCDVLLRFMPKAEALGVDLGGDGLDQPQTVLAQQALIDGIVGNLLDNAFVHGRPASGNSVVTVSLSQRSQGLATVVVLSVLDNGPGIAPALKTKVEERWVRADSQHALRQGFGLGLSIVKAYAKLLGASTEWKDGPGGVGLQVDVVFPP